MREKQIRHYIIFSIIELFPLLIFFLASEIFRRYLLWEKYRNYPLTNTQGDRLASCENIVSRTQALSFIARFYALSLDFRPIFQSPLNPYTQNFSTSPSPPKKIFIPPSPY